MKMKRLGMITLFVLVLVCAFALVGCDQFPMGGDGDAGIAIEGAVSFKAPATLLEKSDDLTAQYIADMIEEASGGYVTAEMIADSVVASGSAIYKLKLTGVPADKRFSEYFEEIEAAYLSSFVGWQVFGEGAPVRFTTKDGNDVLVLIELSSAEDCEITISVLHFSEGAVAELAEALGGSGNGSSGGNGGNGSSGGNGGSGGSEEGGIEISGAPAFTVPGILLETIRPTAAEIADFMSERSTGILSEEDLRPLVDAIDSYIYRITLTNIPEGTDLNLYYDAAEEAYMAKFSGWNVVDEYSPIRYKLIDGKEKMVYIEFVSEEDLEVDIFKFSFEEGTMAALEIALGGEGGQSGNGQSGGGQSSSGKTGENGTYIDGGGKINGGGETGNDDGQSSGGSGDVTGDENGGQQGESSLVRWSIYDVDKDGTESLYMSGSVARGSTTSFDWCGFVVFRDKAFQNEIDPNEEITLREDLVVYRRDNLDRVPVFVTIHYYINGILDVRQEEHYAFFRGEIVTERANTRGGREYKLYRDPAKQDYLFASGAIVIREEDDKAEFYAFREDPTIHKVTFKVGEESLGTILMADGEYIGEYSADDLAKGTAYSIKECTGFGTPVTHDMTVTITDYDVIRQFPITLHMCYDGDVKYTETLYIPVFTPEEEGYEIGSGMGYYLDAALTQPFEGFIKGASTFYLNYYVDLNRWVGN